MEHEHDILAAIELMQMAGIHVIWKRPAGDVHGEHVFRAEGDGGQVFEVKTDDPLVGITELMQQLGFEDLE